MRELLLIWWWSRSHRRHARELARQSRLPLVRPILGAAAALALVFGGIVAFSFEAAPGRDPGQREWTICKPVVIRPLPPSTETIIPCAGADARLR